MLIKKKFTNITKVELNAFIGQFFFGKLFIPMFKNADYNALITSFIISKRTKLNISHLCIIINKLVSGKFFLQNCNGPSCKFSKKKRGDYSDYILMRGFLKFWGF